MDQQGDLQSPKLDISCGSNLRFGLFLRLIVKSLNPLKMLFWSYVLVGRLGVCCWVFPLAENSWGAVALVLQVLVLQLWWYYRSGKVEASSTLFAKVGNTACQPWSQISGSIPWKRLRACCSQCPSVPLRATHGCPPAPIKSTCLPAILTHARSTCRSWANSATSH